MAAMEFFFGFVLMLLALINGVFAQGVKYCASMNTGSDFESVFDKYQSNGACEQTCGNKYAFAIVQGSSCWCSDAAPGDTTSQGDCDEKCPGYPSEKCGSTSEKLYGYIQLFKKPSTTIGGGSTTSHSINTPATTAITSVEPTSPIPTSKSSFKAAFSSTSQSSTMGSSTVLTTLTSSAISTSTSRSKTTDPPSSSTQPDVTIQTSDGQMVTVTVAPTSTPDSSSDSDSEKSGSSVGGGAVAGIVVGSLAGVGAVAGVLIWWFCFYRKRNRNGDDDFDSGFYERPVPRPNFQGTLGSREAAIAASEKGSNGYGSGGSRRVSVPAFTDSRLKPESDIYPNGGRHSNVSLQDHQDYSRPVLRLTNPDPPDN